MGVKGGARLPAALKPRLFAALSPLARLLAAPPPAPTPTPALLHALTTYLSALLPLAVLQDVLSSPVRTILEALFAPTASDAVFAAGCALASALDGLEWQMWDTALGQHVLTASARELGSASTPAPAASSAFDEAAAVPSKRDNSLALLGRLAESARLRALVAKGGAAAVAWEKSVGALVEGAVVRWTAQYDADPAAVDAEQTHELFDVLHVAPCVPSRREAILPLLAALATTVAATPSTEARVAYLSSAASPAQVLGSTLATFSAVSSSASAKKSQQASSSAALDELVSAVEPMITNFAWHRQVMHGISVLSLARLASDRGTPEQRAAIYDAILPNLLSEDAQLRRASLEIALSLFPPAEAPVAADLVARCIDVEDAPLTVQGAREKSMKVRKLGIVANGQIGKEGTTEDVKPALDIVLRYLTGASPALLLFPPRSCSRAVADAVLFPQPCARSTSSRSGPRRRPRSRSSPAASPTPSGPRARASSSRPRRAARTCTSRASPTGRSAAAAVRARRARRATSSCSRSRRCATSRSRTGSRGSGRRRRGTRAGSRRCRLVRRVSSKCVSLSVSLSRHSTEQSHGPLADS